MAQLVEAEKSSVLRLGIIGTGLWAKSDHLPALKELGHLFAITAVCNRSLDKAEAYVQAAGLERDGVFVCSDWREVLARPDVDAVIVALPVYLNLEVATAAAAAGKHALLEKPTAHDLADASALVRLSHERRDEMAIMIGENYPYKNSLRTMARLVMEGAVGSVVTFSLHFWRMFAPDNNPYLYTSWRQNPKHIGGILSDSGVHWVCVVTTVLGPVRSVAAYTRQIQPKNGPADSIVMAMELESGAVGSWAMSHATSRSDALFQVVGTDGMLVLDNLSRLSYHKPNGEVEVTVFEGAKPGKAKQDLVDEFTDFHRCVARTVAARKQDSVSVEKTKGADGNDELGDFTVLPGAPLVRVEDTFHHLAIIEAATASTASKRHEPVKTWQQLAESLN